ncbi:hypothetical protein CDV31_009684 [Fusarium ambrosium]|uniref:Uncharacterized protein n=1 Tax=Fusarium ambrosium TaxID=131363 RepID=A0A428TSY5_9HYPO|nr:hypothetical protein CDV31_009684 [Fusarium ambrosium]
MTHDPNSTVMEKYYTAQRTSLPDLTLLALDIEFYFGYELAVHATRRAKLKSDHNNHI